TNTHTPSLHDALPIFGDQIRIMGGGLVENGGNPARNHYEWMKAIAADMGNLVDAYAEHVYWNYFDSGRLEYRLRDTAHLVNDVRSEEHTSELQSPDHL